MAADEKKKSARMSPSDHSVYGVICGSIIEFPPFELTIGITSGEYFVRLSYIELLSPHSLWLEAADSAFSAFIQPAAAEYTISACAGP